MASPCLLSSRPPPLSPAPRTRPSPFAALAVLAVLAQLLLAPLSAQEAEAPTTAPRESPASVADREEFLASQDLPDEVRSHTALRDRVAPLVQGCLERGDFEGAENLFRHSVALAERKWARGEWSGSSYPGWAFASSVLRGIAHDYPGGGLERIAFQQFVIRRDWRSTLKPCHSAPLFGKRLLEAFERAGGHATPAEAFDLLAAQLHETCRESYPELLGIYFMDFLRELPPPLVRDAIGWADERSQTPELDWAHLAREFAMAGRLALHKTGDRALHALRDTVPDPASIQTHYLSVVRDEALPYPVRTAIARVLCTPDSGDRIGPEVVLASAEVLAEGLAIDSPTSAWASFHIVQEFNRLEPGPEWEFVARRLHETGKRPHGAAIADPTAGLDFRPDSEPDAAIRLLRASLGDAEALRTFLTEIYLRDQLTNTAHSLFLLVEQGLHSEAAALLPGGMEWMDINDDYRTDRRTQVRYTQHVHEQLPAFLQSIGDPALRYFAELLIIGAPDLPPDRVEPGAAYPGRGLRMREAALRFEEADFERSPHGQLLRARSLQQLGAYDGPALVVRSEWERNYTPEAALALCSVEDPKLAELGAPAFATFAAMRLREGDLSGLADFAAAVNEGSSSVGVRRTALAHFSLRFLHSFGHYWPNASPKTLGHWAEAFALIIAEPGHEVAGHPHLSRLAATHLAATLLAGREAEHRAWLDTLDPRRAQLRSDAVKKDPQEFFGGLEAALKYGAPNPRVRASPERRAQALILAFSDPGIQEALGQENPAIFDLIQRAGHLDRELLLGTAGEQLAEVHPRGGWAAAELAQLAAAKGDFETALRWSERSVAECGEPAQAAERYARLVAARAEILVEAGHPAKALVLLDGLAGQLDPTQLSSSAKSALEASRRRAER